MLLRTFFNITGDKLYENLQCVTRGVNRGQVLEIFPGYNEHECWLLSKETKGKQNQMNILAILIANGKNSENKPRGLYFSKALFEGLICGGAYIRRGLSTEGNLRFKLDRASLIVGSKFTIFSFFYFVFEGNFPSTSP